MELVRPADRKGRHVDERADDEVFISRRMLLFKGMFIAGFGGLAAKLAKMQMVDARQYDNQVKGNAERLEILNAPRGLIVDRNGNVLAENRISWTVSILPPDVRAQVWPLLDATARQRRSQGFPDETDRRRPLAQRGRRPCRRGRLTSG